MGAVISSGAAREGPTEKEGGIGAETRRSVGGAAEARPRALQPAGVLEEGQGSRLLEQRKQAKGRGEEMGRRGNETESRRSWGPHEPFILFYSE